MKRVSNLSALQQVAGYVAMGVECALIPYDLLNRIANGLNGRVSNLGTPRASLARLSGVRMRYRTLHRLKLVEPHWLVLVRL